MRTRRSIPRIVTACISIIWIAAVTCESSNAVQASAAQASATPARELVSKYCVTCHNERLKTAGLLLDKADADHVSNSAETWEKVVVQLRSRAMPPASMPRPDNGTYDRVATWLETELDRAASARPNPGRPADLHRGGARVRRAVERRGIIPT